MLYFDDFGGALITIVWPKKGTDQDAQRHSDTFREDIDNLSFIHSSVRGVRLRV